VLTEKENNIWTLNIRSSLDAYRKEVRFHFSDTPYTTAEEFNTQVLAHIAATISLFVNGDQKIDLGNSTVTLGHETIVFYNEIKMPIGTESIKLIGDSFNDIYRHKIKLTLLEKGFDKKTGLLYKNNHFTGNFLLNEKVAELKSDIHSLWPLFWLLISLLALIVFIYYGAIKRKTRH
jgi:hypothetical protein